MREGALRLMRESALWLTGPAPAAAWRRRGVCATPCGRPVALGPHGVREAPAEVALGSVRMWVLCVSGRVGFPTSAAALLESPLLPLPPVVLCRGCELPDHLVSGGCEAGRGGQTPCLGLNDRVGKSCCRPRFPQVAVVRACVRSRRLWLRLGSEARLHFWARGWTWVRVWTNPSGCGVRRPCAVCRLLRCTA